MLLLRNTVLETLALTDGNDGLVGLVAIDVRIAGHGLPVIERALGEGLTTGVGAEIGGETEGLQNGKVSKESHLRGTGLLLLREDMTTTLGEDTVHVTHCILGHGNVTEVDRLKKTGLSVHHGREAHTTGGRHDLTHTTVDSIGVKDDIHEVETAAAHLLLTERTVLGGPGETTNDGLLDLKEVVDSLGGVNEQVGSGALGTEGPDLTSLRDVPAELVGELAALDLGIGSGLDVTVVDGETELGTKRLGLEEETVVLVGGLGKAGLGGLGLAGLTEGDDGVGDLDLGTHEVVLEILEANLEVELTRGGDDVLARLLGVAQNHGVGLGETLHTLDQLGEIGRVLWFDGATNNGRHGELHGLDGVGIVLGTDGTGLEEVLVNTNKGASVTGGDIGDLLSVTAHHDNSTLDVLDPELGLLAGHVVGAHDADLLAGSDLAGEDTAEGVETTLVGGGNHLRDVHTEGSAVGGVAGADGLGGLVVEGTLVEGVDTVGLGLGGGGKVEHNHLKDAVTSGEPLLHDALEQLLANKLLLVGLELDADGLEHLVDLAGLLGHDGLEEGGDGGGNELAEGTLEGAALVGGGPDLALGIEVPVAPELLHHLVLGNTELGAVGLGEALEGEGPLVETGAEGDGTLGGVDLDVTEGLVVVHGNDDVDGLDGTAEGLVELLSGELELEKGTVDLVDHENGLDTLGDGLTEDGLGLDADTIDGVDDDEGTVGDTKGGSNLGGEVNVTGGVNEVDKVGVLRDLNVGLGGLLVLELLLEGGLLLGGHTGDLTGLDVVLEEHGDTGGLDGDTTLGLIGTGVGVTGTAGGLGGDNTGLLDEGIGEGSLAVIDVGNDGHRTDVVLEVHDGPHLLDGEVNLSFRRRERIAAEKIDAMMVNGCGDDRREGVLIVFDLFVPPR